MLGFTMIIVGAIIWIHAATTDTIFNGKDLLGFVIAICGVLTAIGFRKEA